MYTKQIKYRLLENPRPTYGIRRDGSKWFIGNHSIKINDNVLIVEKEKFPLTQGLVDLLTMDHPEKISPTDLDKYRIILLLTNAHRKGFNADSQIVATSGWKYKNVISKLFPPKRSYASNIGRTKLRKKEMPNTFSEDDDDENTAGCLMAYDDDVNVLVDRFRYLEETDATANRREIMCILKELERLGVIEFR